MSNVPRRRFLALGSPPALLALSACATGPERSADQAGVGSAGQHAGALVQAYDSQGDHRTGSAGDAAAAHWLAQEARRAGAEAVLEPFELERIEPRACRLVAGGRHIEGVPLFDAGFTSEDGVSGRLGPLGSEAEIGLAESEPSRLTDPGSESRRAVLSEVRRSRHQAIVLITRGSAPGLFLLNAPSFLKPSGPPTLQVSSVEAEGLHALAAARARVTLVARVERLPSQAANVTARVAGSDPSLAPVVVSTPRSGWWRCAGERGGGIVCWLSALRAAARARPRRDCLFAAYSGHELGWLGMQDYLRRRPDVVRRAHLWLHFGANIGAPRQRSMVNASDAGLEDWAAVVMSREGLEPPGRAPRGSTPFGEAAFVHRGGGRYVALVCDNPHFHSPTDRWPHAIDVEALALHARAFATAVAQAASGPSDADAPASGGWPAPRVGTLRGTSSAAPARTLSASRGEFGCET